jgi:ABC-type transporter Mla MlaB component
MLRITDIRETMPDGGTLWTLKLEGNIQGQWVTELRRAWRAVRLAAGGASIRVVLADVQSVDTDGKVLLTEMHRDGVEILATDSLTAAVRDEIVNGPPSSPTPARSGK